MRPPSYSSSSSSSSESSGPDSDLSSEGWSDSELEVSDHEQETPAICCICDYSTEGPVADVWAHMRAAHNVNSDQQFDLTDDYLRMKLVNYMRKNGRQPSGAADLESDEWLRPVVEEDRLLFEELAEFAQENSPNAGNLPGLSDDPSQLTREQLLAENAFLRAQVEDLRRLLADEDEEDGPRSRPRKGAGRYYTGKSYSGEAVYSNGPIGAPTVFRE
ncbi:Vacuolar protein sorting-associated protein 11 [Perkinsus olseni]|uniref:Vacuolar protein sorting-associated protein 11 n=1 Tax=Perkinsus olseni TaxID=32597 RepID=A0A7J6LBG6_PEROL|nr:Vacuolar protein sorting-associated protein 11 [Perkinsus olseni]KAF4656516.1 Vacuolar protein sorting-associated protein 11 [Perkinsus olseni]